MRLRLFCSFRERSYAKLDLTRLWARAHHERKTTNLSVPGECNRKEVVEAGRSDMDGRSPHPDGSRSACGASRHDAVDTNQGRLN